MSYETRQQTVSSTVGREIDAGLQAHMRNVYNTMCGGLALTGVTAFLTFSIEPLRHLVIFSPMSILFAFAPLIFLMFGLTPARMMRMTSGKAMQMFMGFCVVMGLSFSSLLVVYSGESIARTFFITAGLFAAMSLYGYTTKKDLSGFAYFMIMGATGIFFAILINMLFHSAMISFIVSVVGVVVFTGLTAWETQVIKETYAVGHGQETNRKLAVIGAMSLYMSFINLFQFIMSFMGNRN